MSLLLFLHFTFLVTFRQICVSASTPNNDDIVVVGNYNNTLLKDDGCRFLLDSFAQASANFTFCSIRNARPITLCQGCVGPYVLAVNVHSDILKLMDEAGELCKEKLLNLDKLQVVEGGFGFIAGLWERAACNLCYDLNEEGEPVKLTSQVQEILNLHNETNTCIQNHMNDSDKLVVDPRVCDECKQFYLDLNSRYNHYKDDLPFCMDIVDMVNTTRSLWSVTLGCCLDRQKSEVTFLLMSGIISVLPVLFYLIACRFTGKMERIVAMGNRCGVPYPENSPLKCETSKSTEDDTSKKTISCEEE